MSYRFDVLCEVAAGALGDGWLEPSFTARELGECLHEAQQYLPHHLRYPKPLRRGACAGQVLRRLRQRGLVRLVRPGRWVTL